MKSKLIRIREDLLDEIAKKGKFGQSWNDVLEELLVVGTKTNGE